MPFFFPSPFEPSVSNVNVGLAVHCFWAADFLSYSHRSNFATADRKLAMKCGACLCAWCWACLQFASAAMGLQALGLVLLFSILNFCLHQSKCLDSYTFTVLDVRNSSILLSFRCKEKLWKQFGISHPSTCLFENENLSTSLYSEAGLLECLSLKHIRLCIFTWMLHCKCLAKWVRKCGATAAAVLEARKGKIGALQLSVTSLFSLCNALCSR